MSETVAGLEESLGVRLLNRSTRQLTLTSDGKRVYQHAAQLQQILDDVEADTNQNSMRGQISITCTHDIGVKHLAGCLAEFEQLYPEVSVQLVLSDESVDLIANEIDLAIRVGIPKDSALIGRAVLEEQLQIFANPDYLEKHGMPTCLEQLSDHRWVFLTQLHSRKNFELIRGEERQKISPKQVHFCNAPLMMQKMLSCGMGMGMSLPSTIQDELAKGELVPVLPEWGGPTLTFSIIYPSRRHLPLRTRCLIEFLIDSRMFRASTPKAIG
mgnify:FL=1